MSCFGDEYEAIVTSENFLVTMVERFKEGKRELKPLFDWYASADHYVDSSSPIDLQDIYNMGIEKEYFNFEDIVEDVLISVGNPKAAKAYIKYRFER